MPVNNNTQKCNYNSWQFNDVDWQIQQYDQFYYAKYPKGYTFDFTGIWVKLPEFDEIISPELYPGLKLNQFVYEEILNRWLYQMVLILPERYALYSVLKNSFFSIQFEIFFLISIFFLLLVFVVITNKRNKTFNYFNSVVPLINLIFFSNIFLIILPLFLSLYYFDKQILLFAGFYYSDYLSTFFKLFIMLSFCAFLILLRAYLIKIKKAQNDFEFFIIIYLSLFASCLILNANDLMSLFFSIELQSLCLYVLVAFKQDSSFSTESGLKYFIMGSFSSGLILFGISLIYGFSGVFTYDDLYLFSSSILNIGVDLCWVFYGFLLGFIFLLFGLLFKIGAVPFHMWMPDVYEGAPFIILSYISTIPKLPIIFIFSKFCCFIFFPVFFYYQLVLVLIATLSIILGSIAALYQLKIKRLITYSVIANTGYLILGLSLGNVSAIYATIFYLIPYTAIMLGIFVSLSFLRNWTDGLFLKKITSLLNLIEINPYLSFSFFMLFFSLSGIPPLLGFYPKFVLFIYLLKQSVYLISVIFVVFSAITVFYYIRFVKLSYFNSSAGWILLLPQSYSLALFLSVLIIANCVFFIDPSYLFIISSNFSFYWYV